MEHESSLCVETKGDDKNKIPWKFQFVELFFFFFVISDVSKKSFIIFKCTVKWNSRMDFFFITKLLLEYSHKLRQQVNRNNATQ